MTCSSAVSIVGVRVRSSRWGGGGVLRGGVPSLRLTVSWKKEGTPRDHTPGSRQPKLLHARSVVQAYTALVVAAGDRPVEEVPDQVVEACTAWPAGRGRGEGACSSRRPSYCITPTSSCCSAM